MTETHMTPAERGKQMLRDGGYVHSDEAEDKALIKNELSKARISTRNKGGKIKGKKASENPGRKRRASGGSTDDDLLSGSSDFSPMTKRGEPHSSDTLDDEPPMKKRASGGSVNNDPQIDRAHNPDDDAPSKLARGGRAHGKPGIGKVNIVIAHPGGGAPTPAGGSPIIPPAAAAPPPRPMIPPPGAMPGGAPGGPPMAPPPPAPMAAHPPMPMPPPGGMPMTRPQGIGSGGQVRDVHGRFAGGGV